MLTSRTPAIGINGQPPWARPEFKATGKSPFDYIGDSPDVTTKLPKASEPAAAVAGLLTLGLEHKHAATVLGDETFSAQRVATHAAIRTGVSCLKEATDTMTTALAALEGAKLDQLQRVSSAAAKQKAAAAELDKAKGSAKVKAEAKAEGAAALLTFAGTGKAKRSIGKKGMAIAAGRGSGMAIASGRGKGAGGRGGRGRGCSPKAPSPTVA